ncbi:hypothetical protein [Sporosarcina thermotolerans]|uniref:hypothetical protein n=1 Tax=Sporosarcina thermotolerans TaxID=633404 RepID=UPI00321C16CE
MKTIWHNGKLYTMETEGETIEAILTENGKIIAVGNYDELKNEADEAIDLNGAVLYPGSLTTICI